VPLWPKRNDDGHWRLRANTSGSVGSRRCRNGWPPSGADADGPTIGKTVPGKRRSVQS